MNYLKKGAVASILLVLSIYAVSCLPVNSHYISEISPFQPELAEASIPNLRPPVGHKYHFTVPKGLRKNVNFWKIVYSKYTSDQVIIHDKKHLNVIYAVLDFSDIKNSRFSYRKQRRIRRDKVAKAKHKYRRILNKLAKYNVKTDKLTAEEKRIYDLFSTIDEPNKFIKATGYRRVRAQTGQRDRFIKGLKTSGLYLNEIEKIFASYNMPQELTLLPFVESFFNVDAHSVDGAVGIWQFIRSTGRLYLKINSSVDERKDPYKASHAAAQFLKSNYETLGAWPLALTAYNHGVGGMQRAVRKTGSKDLVKIIKKYRSRRFGFASRNFYAEFLAVLELVPNYDRYFGNFKLYRPLKFDTVKIPHYVDLNTIIKNCLVAKDDIKKLNPALKHSILSSQRFIPKGYELRIPYGTKDTFEKLYANIPPTKQYTAQKRDEWHRVRRGDTLSKIARRYRTTIRALMDLNNLSSSRFIRAGQKLRIPGTRYKAVAKVKAKKTTQKRLAKAKVKTTQKPKKQKKSLVKNTPSPKNKNKYTASIKIPEPALNLGHLSEDEGLVVVKPHESIGHYADWAKVSARSIRRLNKIKYSKKIHVGKAIKVNYSKVGKI